MLNTLETFLETTSLKNNPNYVEALFKTANSKNITIEEWNNLINQLINVISQNAETYLGFEKTLSTLKSVKLKLDADSENTEATLNDIRISLNDAIDTLTSTISNLENVDARVSVFEQDITVDDSAVKFSKPIETYLIKLSDTDFTETYLRKINALLDVMDEGSGTRLYAVKEDGTPTFKVISSSGTSTTTVLTRDVNGRCGINYPTEYLHISNKQYVDDMCQNLKEYINELTYTPRLYATVKFNNVWYLEKPTGILPWVKLGKLGGGGIHILDNVAVIDRVHYLTVNGDYVNLPDFSSLYDEGFGWSLGSGNDTKYNYVDFETKSFYRNVNRYIFTGEESWFNNGGRSGQFYTDKMFSAADSKPLGICTHYTVSEAGAYDQNKNGHLSIRGSRIWIFDTTFGTDANVVKKYMKDMYDAGTPVTVFYPSKTVTAVEFDCDDVYFPLVNDSDVVYFNDDNDASISVSGALTCMREVPNGI